MSGRAKKVAAPKRKANGYKMPAPIPIGEVISDTIMKKKWRIGPSIGVGGFGEIYSACEHLNSPKKGSDYPFVIKIEPHENGPLFVEKNFYMRNANKDDITSYMKSKKLTSLGMPTFYGNGSHDFKGEKYRYLVLERYGKDIWSLFKNSGRCFPAIAVFKLGLQMLDVLEYIHSRGYVHADIKGANILLGLKRGTEQQAYLLDFGLATRVSEKEFKPDPKCAHNGTIEYTSRDAHLGVPTMRGDLEILGYNMLQWLVGELPWERSLKQPKAVQDMKEAFLKQVRQNITNKYKGVPDALIKFFEYINTLKPKDTPNYTKCRQLFESYLKSEGVTKNSKLDFTQSKKSKVNKIKAVTSNEDSTDEEESEVTLQEEKRTQKRKSPQKKITQKVTKQESVTSPLQDNEDCENEQPTEKRSKKTLNTSNEDSSDEEETEVSSQEEKQTQKRKSPRKKITQKVSKKESVKSLEDDENYENEQPKKTLKIVKKRVIVKRKSNEPVAVTKIKKTKLTPKSTPPAKQNHANIATQTSVERLRSPRNVTFDSPISQIIGQKRMLGSSREFDSANSSGDVFDDSFTITEKKLKKTLLSDEEVVVKRIVKKKVTKPVKAKAKSWKDSAAIVNGRSPPVS